MRPGPLRSFLIIFFLVSTLVMNALATLLPLNGKSTGELSDKYPILTVPAGYAFSIWSVIYTGLIIFAVWQALPAQRDNPRIARIAVPFLLNCVANIGWLVAWHWEQVPLSMLLMVAILATLIVIYRRLRADGDAVSMGEKVAMWAPFSIYMGWITVATVVNATVLLYSLGWQDTGPVGAAMAAATFVVATLIVSTIALRFRDALYPLVAVWAFIAIAQKHAAVALVANSALVLAAVIAIVAGYAFFKALRGGTGPRGALRTA